MKRVVSVSLGSRKRDHSVNIQLNGEQVIVERIGTDGNFDELKRMIYELDGEVDAFGLGGMDLYLSLRGRRYLLREAEEILKCRGETPIVDGSGLKNSLERKVIDELTDELFNNETKVLMVCALDRFGMAEKLSELNSDVIYGDLMFSLGLPIPIKSLNTLDRIARVLFPVVKHLPFDILYPTGKRETGNSEKYRRYYHWADVICGDFHYINKYLPNSIQGKTIITNTVTNSDIELLKKRGLSRLITTTPSIEGRSFGTNVLEAMLVALDGSGGELNKERYEELLTNIGFSPLTMTFNNEAG